MGRHTGLPILVIQGRFIFRMCAQQHPLRGFTSRPPKTWGQFKITQTFDFTPMGVDLRFASREPTSLGRHAGLPIQTRYARPSAASIV